MARVCITVPATSANVGVGYDCLGLALGLYVHISFEPSTELRITGCPEAFRGPDNLVWTSYCETCERLGQTPQTHAIHINSPIPLAGGLGSSSACIVAGVYAALYERFGSVDRQQALELACAIEGHPDNVAPAIFGGLTCSFINEDRTHSITSNIDPDYTFVLIVPPYEVRTADARRVMPTEVPIQTAIWQMSRCVAVVQALEQGNEQLLYAACRDKLHEPHRAPLIADYQQAKMLAYKAGASAFVISGSGATMLAICKGHTTAQAVEQALSAALPACVLRLVVADTQGSRILEVDTIETTDANVLDECPE